MQRIVLNWFFLYQLKETIFYQFSISLKYTLKVLINDNKLAVYYTASFLGTTQYNQVQKNYNASG